MRRFLHLLVLIITVVVWSSCRKDLDYPQSTGKLEFSKDTVFLDTVFTNIGSSTRTLKVYNRTRDDIEISTIRLSQGENSSYRLNVDGEAGKEFENIPLLARDSLFIFIESTFDVTQTNQVEFLNTDAIQFDPDYNLQEVQLVTLVKDAIFLFPKTTADGTKETLDLGLDAAGNPVRIEGFYLTDEQLSFTNQKAYVIYGYAAVPDGKELNVAEGARVHFHKDSGLLVKSGASIQVNGSLSDDQELLEKEVVFEGDRLESELNDVPGQWGTIWISSGSINYNINHLTIRNATVGLFVEGDGILQAPTLSLKNTQILNSASVNLWGKSATITGENLVLGGAGDISLYCNLGGSYSFVHSTIANFWRNGFRTGTALKIDNFNELESKDLLSANFTNSIIDGNTFLELSLSANQNNIFNYSFANCLIKFNDSGNQFQDDPLYDFNNNSLFIEVRLNESLNFFDTSSNDFRLADPSPARDNANFEGANLVPLDLLGRDRTGSPDIGAYEVEVMN